MRTLLLLTTASALFLFSNTSSLGQLQITTSKNASRGWDGKIMGIDQPNGMFIWTVERIDYTGKIVSRKGMTTLIR